MMAKSDYSDYMDIVMLLKTPEWRTWVSFIESRVLHLSEKVIRQVREKEFEEATKTVAVIDDIQRQLHLFRNRKMELEEKFNNGGTNG